MFGLSTVAGGIKMNYNPFGTPFTASIPAATVHQYATAKLAQNVAASGQVVGVLSGGDGGVHYLHPLDPNEFTIAGQGAVNNQHTETQPTLITLPITIGGKPGEPGQQQAIQIQVVNPNATIGDNGASGDNVPKYHIPQIALQQFSQGIFAFYSDQQIGTEALQVQFQQPQVQVTQTDDEPDVSNNSAQHQITIQQDQDQRDEHRDSQHQVETHSVGTETEKQVDSKPQATVTLVAHHPQELLIREGMSSVEIEKNEGESEKGTVQIAIVKSEETKDEPEEANEDCPQQVAVTAIPATWQNLAAPGITVADYLSRIPATSFPIGLHHFLKFPTIKREGDETVAVANTESAEVNSASPEVIIPNGKQKKKRKYKKKPPKPRVPRPGQVHIATALDGTTLFCCPECHMAYSEKELLEEHLLGHKIERRFICDICGAGLKRKEHLERHKLGHNPGRPFVCSVCMKGFKRKEHLNLHFVIHSDEKTEICPECGKGFYRRDHLRKHARSHLTRRMKEDMQNQKQLQQQIDQEHSQQLQPQHILALPPQQHTL